MLIQVRPLRDVFAALFFVSIGMLLDPHFFAVHWLKIVIVTAAVVIGKAALATFSLWVSVKKIRTAIVAGVGLAQIGEFSFVLASMGSARNLIPAEISGVILSSALVTLLLAPFMLNAASLWAKSAGK
jgi:CPA2 family monovalent cation:H+ antiporter-2